MFDAQEMSSKYSLKKRHKIFTLYNTKKRNNRKNHVKIKSYITNRNFIVDVVRISLQNRKPRYEFLMPVLN